jgi:hypothetical protein
LNTGVTQIESKNPVKSRVPEGLFMENQQTAQNRKERIWQIITELQLIN